MNTPQILVLVLTSSGVSAIAASLIAGLFSKRKLGAEATQIITSAAAGVVSDLRAELTRKSAEMNAMIAEHQNDRAKMKADHVREISEIRRVLRAHSEWDALAVIELRKVNVTLPDPPELFPEL